MADITITEEQMSKIRHTLNGFRYGGMTMHAPRKVEDGESLLTWLREFSGVLEGVSDRATAKEEELNQIKEDIRGAGRLFALIQDA